MKSSFLRKLFPSSKASDEDISPISVESSGAQEPGLGLFAGGFSSGSYSEQGNEAELENIVIGGVQLRRMPLNRFQQYDILRVMASDPTIDSAINIHLAQALASKKETGEIIEITGEGEIVEDLRETFSVLLNENLMKWTYPAALFGFNPFRVYGKPGTGVTLVRSDYYTSPYFTRRFERAGETVGWSSKYQNEASLKKGMIVMMEPWKFIEIRMPEQSVNLTREPIRQSNDIFDIGRDDYMNEGFIEASDYGTSIIKAAYEPWLDLQEAILSLNMSRKKASNIERLIGVQVGKLNPQKAAQYLNTINRQISKTAEAQAQKSLKQGYVKTVWNHIFPIFGYGQGQMDISTLEGQVDIAHIEDIRFHINRLGGAVGIDPSMLGFGEMLSGGMGDGGFLRMSIQAGLKAEQIRTAVSKMINDLFEIHVALKYDKIFSEDERPWGITFNAISTAIAREEAEEKERNSQFAMTLIQILQMINPQLENTNQAKLQKYLLTSLFKMTEKDAEEISKDVVSESESQDEDFDLGDDDPELVLESVAKEIKVSKEHIEQVVLDYLLKIEEQ